MGFEVAVARGAGTRAGSADDAYAAVGATLVEQDAALAEIARVLRSAQEFSLPVYIEVPRDLVGAEIGTVAPGKFAAAQVRRRRAAGPERGHPLG